jgi:hypothetical protein
VRQKKRRRQRRKRRKKQEEDTITILTRRLSRAYRDCSTMEGKGVETAWCEKGNEVSEFTGGAIKPAQTKKLALPHWERTSHATQRPHGHQVLL